MLLEQKVSTTRKAINEIFGAIPRSRIALETGTHSPWVSRLLSELGHEAIVAHARSVRLIGESRRNVIQGIHPKYSINQVPTNQSNSPK